MEHSSRQWYKIFYRPLKCKKLYNKNLKNNAKDYKYHLVPIAAILI